MKTKKQKLEEIRVMVTGGDFIAEILKLCDPAEMELLKSAIYQKYGAQPINIIDLGCGIPDGFEDFDQQRGTPARLAYVKNKLNTAELKLLIEQLTTLGPPQNTNRL